MKFRYLSILIFACLTMLAFLPSTPVLAKEQKLESIDIHTFIHEDGSATITEIRNATLLDGTENFDIIENLGKSEIIDFTVEENGKVYEFIEHWNIDASREEKSFKNGIIKTDDGYELTWGIGEYGSHEYILQYTVTNFVKQLEDSQVLFWRYVNDGTNIPPEKVTIEVETEKELNVDDEKIWAFGFEGEINFDNGKVIAQSDAPLSNNHYATILIKFADGQFATSDIINKTFEEVREEAFIDSDYNSPDESNAASGGDFLFWMISFFLTAMIILVPLFIILIVIIFIIYRIYQRKQRANIYKGEYERDYPYDGPFVDTYQLLIDLGVSSFEQLIAAFLLKWVKDEYIEIKNEEVGGVFKSEAPVIYLRQQDVNLNQLEGKLFNMLLQAAEGDTRLERKQFVNWIEKHKTTMHTWEHDVRKSSINTLQHNGFFQLTEKQALFIKRTVHELTEQGHDLEARIYKFINYLRDFSLLNEHEPVNVKIWDDIMIWAAVLGLTDEVYKQFRKLYPAYVDESTYSTVVIASTISLSRSINEAQSHSSSVDTGGGGSSSIGGGGGSFGGGSGGGTR